MLIRRSDGEDVPATVVHIPANPFDRRVLVELDPRYALYGTSTVVVRRAALKKAR